MPRQFGKVDVSAGWLPCPRCPHRHVITAPCPPPGVWLVLTFCPRCDAKTGRYCSQHRGRGPQPEPVRTLPEVDVQQLAAGDREEGG